MDSDESALLQQLQKQLGPMLNLVSKLLVHWLKKMATSTGKREEWQGLINQYETSAEKFEKALFSDDDFSMESMSDVDSFISTLAAIIKKVMETVEIPDEEKQYMKSKMEYLEMSLKRYKRMMSRFKSGPTRNAVKAEL